MRIELTPALEDEDDTVLGAVLVYSCGLTGIAVGTGGRDIVESSHVKRYSVERRDLAAGPLWSSIRSLEGDRVYELMYKVIE